MKDTWRKPKGRIEGGDGGGKEMGDAGGSSVGKWRQLYLNISKKRKCAYFE